MSHTLVHPSTEQPPFEPYYAETVFVAQRPVGGWPSVFAIITAQNPHLEPGQPPLSRDEEERRMSELARRLRSARHAAFPVVGASADLRHQEIGEGIPTQDLHYVAQLARDFGQWGFFWVQQGMVYICTDDSGAGWHIGSWKEKLQAGQLSEGFSRRKVSGHDSN